MALIIPPKYEKAVLGYSIVSNRIIYLRMRNDPNDPNVLNIIQVHAPTSTPDNQDIEDFYGELEASINRILGREVTIIIGDLNAKIGRTNLDHDMRQILGSFGLGERNERGEHLLDFCLQHRLTVMNTWFKHHPRRLYTWRSPGDRTRNQIDYILINRRWKSSITNVKTYPSADCGSDHQLLAMNLRLRLRNAQKTTVKSPILNESAMECFREKVGKALTTTMIRSSDTVESSWRSIKQEIIHAAQQYRNTTGNPKKPWIRKET